MGVVILINKTDNAEPSFNKFLINLLCSLHVCFWGRVALVVGQSINSSKLNTCQFSAIKSAQHHQGAGLTHHVLPFFEKKAWKRLSCAAKVCAWALKRQRALEVRRSRHRMLGLSRSDHHLQNIVCSAGCTSHWQKTI